MIALLENLKSHLPFSILNVQMSKLIEESAQIAYYPNHTTLIETGTKPDKLFYIIKGRVEAKDDEELIDIYHEHDTLGGIELVENQPSQYQYLVTEELICYEIPLDTFLTLCDNNREFKAYFFSTIVDRMEMRSEKNEYSSVGELMVARVDSTLLHKVCVVEANTPIVDALKKMDECKSSSLIINNPEGYGIVTDADFRHYILHKDEERLETIEQIQTYPIITINDGELLFNILLLLTERSIKHLPVLNDEGELIGMLELIDVISSFSSQSHLITAQIEKAESLEALISASSRVMVMIDTLHDKGVKSRYIAKLVSEMNKRMYTKLFEMIMPSSWHNRCTLILLGSEGRSEQILRTDQDNALIFEDGFEPEDVEEVTLAFIEVLDKIGFPRCEGNVMIINPKWRKSQSEFKQNIDNWLEHPSMEGFMDMAIFFDSIAVAGVTSLHSELIAYLVQRTSEHKEIIRHFAKAIENFESSLGLFSQFVSHDKAHKNEIDIKKGALFALVHGVRALALEHGITKTNTTLRIKELNNLDYISKEDAKNLMEALEVINTLRLHAGLEKFKRDEEVDNYISIETLGKLEKDLLKEALKTVNGFKKTVSYHFRLSMLG
ncbi:MAG: cyclic nucleotide-binding domain-containing protein [Epsilonproteobacteria bacterium]|nr:cyclic nucleotide-binding domain-containing protein [Campylobacterota bacterium]